MQDELSFLIQLQDRDVIVDGLKEKAEAITPSIQAKTQELESLKTGLKSSKEKLAAHQLKKKQLEGEAEAQEKLVQKHQGELNSLKSNDAYKAMLGEIQAAKQAVVKIEDEILVVMEQVETAERAAKDVEKKLKSDETVIKSAIQDLESKKNEVLAEAKAKQDERDAYAKTVPPALLSQYDSIREKRGGVAIAPMVNGACGGCRMKLTQAKANEIKKAKIMVLCESCSRILYLPVEKSDAAAPPPPPPPSQPAAPTPESVS